MNPQDQQIVDSTPFDETEINYQEWLDDAESALVDQSAEELKRTIVGLSRRLAFRFKEAQNLAAERDAWRQTANNVSEAMRELKARSLSTLQMRVAEWRKAAYPDTAAIELQALGVAEESGELAHAVLKFKQGIRGYDFTKTHDEVGDAIGDIIIYAMGVADHLDISVEEALYKTVEHVINRNITQGSNTGQARIEFVGNDPMPHVYDAAGNEVTHGEFRTLEPRPLGSKLPDVLTPHEQKIARDAVAQALSPKPVAEVVESMPKGIDYAGHVPDREEGAHQIGCNNPNCLGNCY